MNTILSEEEDEEKNNLEHMAKYIFKLILVGDTNTGKTTICNTILNRNNKTMQYQPTIGIDFNGTFETIYTNTLIKVQLWDTAGQEKFRSIINSYYRNTCGTILTYNITNRTSFNNLTRWIEDIYHHNNCRHEFKHPILLFGTCKDLEKKRQVSYDEALKFSMKYPEMTFREINSFIKKGALQDGYYELLRLIYDKIEKERKQILLSIPIGKPVDINNNYIQLNVHSEKSNVSNINDLLSCKGVKYLKNSFEIEELNFKQEAKSDQDRPSKYCGKCN